jgi:cell division protein FtsA
VNEAEQQAGRTVREIVLGLSGGRLESVIKTVDLDLGGRAVTSADISHALALARAQARGEGREVLHALPVEISLDDSPRLRDARGMVGHRLHIAVHVVRTPGTALHNLLAAIERCHLDVAAVVAAPYAAGLACLSEDEATFGAVVVDLGAGVTGIARFADGRLHELATLPLGAQHVTQDLAFGLSTGRAQAERLKTLYGSVLARAGDVRQHLEVPGLGDPMRPPLQIVSRARLTEIIRPRVEEILQLARARIDLDRQPVTGRRLVLTGGGSQLEGIVELAEETFSMPARLGHARPFDAGSVQDLTAATTAVGLLRWASEDDGGLTFGANTPNRDFTARLARLGQWLRENF